MKLNLVFEKVGDINSDYPYLCVYREGEREPFMEISVNQERKIEFVFYSRADNLSLSSEEFYEIYGRAAFLPQALENEDSL
ncbi:hypothetical protein ACR3IF_04480 [Pseudomonas aeruginosa]|uniref:hypothetical protein n=1 Tax=Pseudomonas aeruginosa TaxID=287 RepID=UPI003D9C72BD